jgi:hypothetical protein
MNIIKEGYGYYLSEEEGLYKVYYLDINDNYVFLNNLNFSGHSVENYLAAWADFINAFEENTDD